MAQYQFRLADGLHASCSTSLDDDASAMLEAKKAACGVLLDELQEHHLSITVTVTVIADDERPVGTVEVSGSATSA